MKKRIFSLLLAVLMLSTAALSLAISAMADDVTVEGTAGITAVKTGSMGGDSSIGALRIQFDRNDTESLKALSCVERCPSAIPGKMLSDLVTINGVTVTELIAAGNVARLCFYGDMLVFHIDVPEFLSNLKAEGYEIVILPGFHWVNWTQDDWGNWEGTNVANYIPVDGSLVTEPISFYVNMLDEVYVKGVSEETTTESAAEPEATVTEPEATVTEPEVTTTEPEVTTTEPEVTTTEPEVTTTEPEVTTTEPEVTTTEPEATVTEPEVATTEPEITQPEAKPSQKEKGCGSAVSGVMAIVGLSVAAGALCLARKKDE